MPTTDHRSTPKVWAAARPSPISSPDQISTFYCVASAAGATDRHRQGSVANFNPAEENSTECKGRSIHDNRDFVYFSPSPPLSEFHVHVLLFVHTFGVFFDPLPSLRTSYTETANKDGTWLLEMSSCCCLTTAGKTRQLLLDKIYIPFCHLCKSRATWMLLLLTQANAIERYCSLALSIVWI